jgi:galactose mutarotase-like enzyme
VDAKDGNARDFGQFDCGGWDEIFPTVNPCRLPDSAWGDRQITDHGELWYRPWQVLSADCDEAIGARLCLAAEPAGMPFRFMRTLTLGGGPAPLIASYKLSSRGDRAVPYLWAAHPLLAIRPGDQIRLPEGTSMISTASVGTKLHPESPTFGWPVAHLDNGERFDFSQVPTATGFAVKLFTEQPHTDWVEVVDSSDRSRIRFDFASSEIPHVGLWLNYGGWSGAGTEPYFNAGIEPTTQGFDDLAIAVQANDVSRLDWEARTWSLSISCL